MWCNYSNSRSYWVCRFNDTTHYTSYFGSDMKNLIPMSAIGGAIILTISDVIGRIIGSPSELEVGIITAFLGAPILIMIARKAKVKSI